MEDNYKFATLMHWVAAVAKLPRNDGGGVNNRHCEESKTTRQSSAFSLIELLISLIIISLIVSSFIPIITRKIKHHNATISSGVMNCKKFDEKCMLCDKKECTLCTTQINLLDGQYVNPKVSCEVKQCPDNCDKCEGETCTKCKEDYSLNEGKCIKGDCLKIGNICVQRKNAGDKGGLEIPANLIDNISATDSPALAQEHTHDYCWIGQTSLDCDAKGGYSGCNRTVCTWGAAYKICSHYGLRLPTYSEAASFAINSIGKGEDGLQLCDTQENALSPKCATAYRCPDSHSGSCIPGRIWTLRRDGKNPAQSIAWRSNGGRGGGFTYSLNNGEWVFERSTTDDLGEHECMATTASVRCVSDL